VTRWDKKKDYSTGEIPSVTELTVLNTQIYIGYTFACVKI